MNSPTSATETTDVAIVGGGLAGLAAAEALSRNHPKMRLVLLESKRNLGGRAGSFADPRSQDPVDYCQHAAMGCCTNLIDLLRQCSLEHFVRRDKELTFLHPEHPPSRFAASTWLPAPLHLLGAIQCQLYLSARQKREIKRGLWKLMRTPSHTLSGRTAADWLSSIGQSDLTRREFWDVILVSALGERTDLVAMSAARKVLIDGFAAARGASDVLIPTLPLSELFGRRLTASLERRGVDIRSNAAVRQIKSDQTLETSTGIIHAKHVICAVPWHSIERLFDGWTPETAAALPATKDFSSILPSPISGIHLWFDREITPRKHSVMVGTVSQWLFRDPFEDAALPQETVSSPETDSAKNQRQHYFQVVISASKDHRAMTKEQLVETVLAELRHAFPEARQANLLRSKVVTDPHSVFSVSPAIEQMRPDTDTELPWLKLAGDWIATGWPATMESAVISGRRAAGSVLDELRSAKLSPSDQCKANDPQSSGTSSPYAQSLILPGLRWGWLSRLLIRP